MDSRLPKFKLKERDLLPIVQGGMGVGISAHRLAGAVAREGAVLTCGPSGEPATDLAARATATCRAALWQNSRALPPRHGGDHVQP
jgi:NAD(P)H-dependent flavin oxidoreductase YrpB (nitropropane dioxygenase family)